MPERVLYQSFQGNMQGVQLHSLDALEALPHASTAFSSARAWRPQK